MMRPAKAMSPALAAALAAVAAAAPARAQEVETAEAADYDTSSAAWNGLSTLEALARGMALEVKQERSIAWDDLERGDILFILYPTSTLNPQHLATFLANEFYEGRSYAPVARPLMPDHPLAVGVKALTANHPSLWNAARGADSVFGFEGGDSLVAAVQTGEGRLVALSDPSVLINRMLEFDGNLEFAINLIRYLSRPGESRRLVILTGDFALLGEPSRVLGEDGHVGVVGMLADFNRWLIGLNEYVLSDPGMRILAVSIALLVAAVALVWLPRARQSPLDGSWTRARGGPADLPSAEQVLAEVDRPGRRPSFALPAAILRDSINARLALVLGKPDPLNSMTEADLMAAVHEQAGRGAAEALGALYQSLRALPTRTQAASPWQAPFVGQRDFERLSAAADQLYRSLQVEG